MEVKGHQAFVFIILNKLIVGDEGSMSFNVQFFELELPLGIFVRSKVNEPVKRM